LHTELHELLGRKPRLLIVDDQALNIQALHRVFAADCQVFMATSGAQALQLCSQQLPDLVLLDVQMPDMDGFEVCLRLKADAQLREIPVVFVTAHQDGDTETRGLDCGAVDFISKPFNPAVVRARVRTQLSLKLQSDLLREVAFIDGLTGLHNRRFFDERFNAELQRAQRNKSNLAIALIDVDFFKRYNDHYGHLSGDDCLRAVALALRLVLKRPGDIVCRFGGEEFACVLPETDAAGALAVGRAMEQTVRALRTPHAMSDVADVVTVSVGMAVGSPSPDWTMESMLSMADSELYRAKAEGRGQVRLQQLSDAAIAA
jgi:diguanylate cyclase (GGDEF)-like protein